jgi:hypothetical protein
MLEEFYADHFCHAGRAASEKKSHKYRLSMALQKTFAVCFTQQFGDPSSGPTISWPGA